MKRSLVVAMAAVVTLSAAACGSDSGQDGQVTLTLANVGGATSERQRAAFFEPFEQETGIKISDVQYTNIVSQVKDMVDSGNYAWDIVHSGADEAFEHCGTLFEEVDYSDLGDVFPEGTTNPCTAPGGKYTFQVGYDTEAYKDQAPTSVKDFFDTEKFPGKRAVRANNVRGVVELALVADGVAPDDLYPLDIDRALRKLDTIKSDLVFVPSWNAMAQQMSNRQVTWALCVGHVLGDLLDQGHPVAPLWDVNFWDYDAYVIPKGNPKKEQAVQAIKFFLQLDRLEAYANLGGLVPVRTDFDMSKLQVSEGSLAFNPWAVDGRGTLVHLDTEYWAENQESVAERYVEWQAG